MLGVTQPIVSRRLAELGLGGVILSSRTARGADSKLVPLPVSLGPMKVGLHLVSARSAPSVPRVRAVADLLAAELVPAQRVERGR